MGANLTIFSSAVSALGASSLGLSVAANNIANVNTPGFSRQRAILATVTPQRSGGLEIGRGVEPIDVQRIYDAFTEQGLRDAAASKEENDGLAENLEQIEAIFNEVNTIGLSQYIQNFFNAFHDVANNPDKQTPRVNLLGQTDIMVTAFDSISQKLKDARTFIDGGIKSAVARINSLAEEITDLNTSITTAAGDTLSLQDQRQFKTRELAELIDVTAVESADGTYQVYVAQGMPLVTGVQHASLSVEADSGNGGHYKVNFQLGASAAAVITTRINGGQLKGLIAARDTEIPGYQSTFDQLAYEIHDEVNTIHLTGFDLDGNTATRFFTLMASSTDAAANLALNSTVNGDPRGVAAAGTAASLPGGNSVALALAALQNTNITFTTGSSTFSEFYGDLLSTVGADTQSAKNKASFSDQLFIQAETRRERISGVSVEEEQLNLIRYQSAFHAASKLMTVADELLRILVNLI